MSFWITAFDTLSKGLEVVSAGLDIYASVKGVQGAEEMRKLQKQELQRQQQMAEIAARREARVRTARLLASQGSSGAIMSTTAAGVIGIGTSLSAGLLDLSARTSFNMESVDMQASAAKLKNIAGGVAALGSAVKPAQEFADMLTPTKRMENQDIDFDSFTTTLPRGAE